VKRTEDDEWEDDEPDPLKPGKTQTAMVFALIKKSQKEHPTDPNAEANKLAAQWRDLMLTGGIDQLNIFAVEPDRLLIVVQDKARVPEVMKFVLSRPETIEFEWDQRKYYPSKQEDE